MPLWERGRGRFNTRQKKSSQCDHGGRDQVQLPQAEEDGQPPEKARNGSCPRAPRGTVALPATQFQHPMMLIADFWPPELWQDKFLLRHQVCDSYTSHGNECIVSPWKGQATKTHHPLPLCVVKSRQCCWEVRAPFFLLLNHGWRFYPRFRGLRIWRCWLLSPSSLTGYRFQRVSQVKKIRGFHLHPVTRGVL